MNAAAAQSGKRFLAVVFAGGGSGGHIFPAVAVAERIAAHTPDAAMSFLISQRPLDAELIRAERPGGREPEFTALPAQPFGLGPARLRRFLKGWRPSVKQVRAQLRELKSHYGRVVVVGTGGFVTAPAFKAARAERVRSALVNLDAVPGRANRWAASHATKVFTAADTGPDSWVRVPPVVRAASIGGDQDACREALGLDAKRHVLFVSGGSQGAKSVNDLMLAFLDEHGPKMVKNGWQVVHQSGAEQRDALAEAYREHGVDAVVRPVFAEVGLCWGAATVALGRGGAGTVAEAWANRVPLIVMPYPYHKDQHQALNARPLETFGLAVVKKDLIDRRNLYEGAGSELLACVNDPEGGWRAADKEKAFGRLGPADGAERVAQAVLHGLD